MLLQLWRVTSSIWFCRLHGENMGCKFKLKDAQKWRHVSWPNPNLRHIYRRLVIIASLKHHVLVCYSPGQLMFETTCFGETVNWNQQWHFYSLGMLFFLLNRHLFIYYTKINSSQKAAKKTKNITMKEMRTIISQKSHNMMFSYQQKRKRKQTKIVEDLSH